MNIMHDLLFYVTVRMVRAYLFSGIGSSEVISVMMWMVSPACRSSGIRMEISCVSASYNGISSLIPSAISSI